MPPTPPTIPADVRDYLSTIFGGANGHVTSYLSAVPNAHEPHLDTALISYISRQARPVRLPSNWVVRIDTHFLGSGRHWDRWEIADIGVLLLLRRQGELFRTKVALLQSKRLYPNERQQPDRPNWVGMGALREADEAFVAAIAPRRFTFSDSSRYRALQIDDDQYRAIEDYENVSSIPVYYSFYNPSHIPLEIDLPSEGVTAELTKFAAGLRILPAHDFRTSVAPTVEGLAPSYGDVCRAVGPFADQAHKGGWRFEHFVVDLLLGCKTGYRVDSKKDATLANLFGGRSAPISAAVSINIDLPANAAFEPEPVA